MPERTASGPVATRPPDPVVPPGPPPFARTGVGAVAAVAGVVLLWSSGRYGFFGDELYFRVSGDRLMWSFADNGPVVPLLARLMSSVAPDSLTALRLPSVLLTVAAIVATGLTARELGGGRSAQVLAVATYATSPLLLAQGAMLSTNATDTALWTVTTWLVARWARTRADRWLFAAGAVTAVALQVKWLIPVFWAAAGAAALLVGPRELPRRPGLWAGGGHRGGRGARGALAGRARLAVPGPERGGARGAGAGRRAAHLRAVPAVQPGVARFAADPVRRLAAAAVTPVAGVPVPRAHGGTGGGGVHRHGRPPVLPGRGGRPVHRGRGDGGHPAADRPPAGPGGRPAARGVGGADHAGAALAGRRGRPAAERRAATAHSAVVVRAVRLAAGGGHHRGGLSRPAARAGRPDDDHGRLLLDGQRPRPARNRAAAGVQHRPRLLVPRHPRRPRPPPCCTSAPSRRTGSPRSGGWPR